MFLQLRLVSETKAPDLAAPWRREVLWMVEDVSEPPEKWVQRMSLTADGAEKVV